MAIKGDFTGFTFNNRHSSEFGIMRVSNGSRYNENLLPNFQDRTAQIAGGDGTYYWDSSYTQKPFPLQIAFDALTEEKYRDLVRWLSSKKICELIFDERPYKKYMVKIQGTPTLNTICFSTASDDESLYDLYEPVPQNDGGRVYKGEGSISFIAYYPYAKSVHKFLDEYDVENYPTKNEWALSSKMKATQGDYDGLGKEVFLYNAGDLETDLCIFYEFENDICELSQVDLSQDNGKSILTFNAPIAKKSDYNDIGFRINSKTNLIEGYNAQGELTGSLYNDYIKAGDFFKVPLEESMLTSVGAECVKVEYDYLYY